MSLLQFYWNIKSTDKPGYHWKPARDPLEASQGPMKGSRGPTRGQLGDKQEHKIERHTKMTFHILWSLTSRSIPSLVQNRNQSSIISCLSDSREDTGQASFCGFKLMTTKIIIIQNYEHAWRTVPKSLGNKCAAFLTDKYDLRQNRQRQKRQTAWKLLLIKLMNCKERKGWHDKWISKKIKTWHWLYPPPVCPWICAHAGCGI